MDTTIPTDAAPWVVRTFNDRPELWANLKQEIAAPVGSFKFLADVRFVDDPRFYGLSGVDLVHALPDDYPGGFVFAATGEVTEAAEDVVELTYFYPDSTDATDYERPPSAVPATDIQMVKHLPHVVQELENNLSIANIDMDDVRNGMDGHEIYRGVEPPSQ